MEEYIISIQPDQAENAPSDWMEQIVEYQGVIKIAETLDKIFVKSSSEIVEQIQKESSYYKIEIVATISSPKE